MAGTISRDTEESIRQLLESPQGRAAIRLSLYRRDFRRFAREQLQIKTKDARIGPMYPLFDTQEDFLRSAEAQYREMGFIRQVWLKSRQQGVSALSLALNFQRSALSPYVNAFSAANDRPTAENLFRTVKLFYESLAPEFRPKTRWCVDGETECLSREGWKRWNQIRIGEEIYSLDPMTGNGTWAKVQGLFIDEEFSGEMIRWSSHDIDAITTPDHKWLVTTFPRRKRPPGISRPGSGGTPRVDRLRYSFVESRGMSKYHLIPRAAGCKESRVQLSDDCIRLLGWIVSEGSFERGTSVRIYQSEKANKDKVDEIREILHRLKIPFSEYRRRTPGTVSFSISGDWSIFIRTLLPEKRFTYEFISGLSSHQAGILLAALIAGDGTINGNTRVYYSADRILRPQIQAIAALAGHSSAINDGGKQRKNRKRAIARYGDLKQVSIHHCDSALGSGFLKTQRTLNHHGVIWCPKTATGTWLARRNSKVYFTGNSNKRELVFEDEEMPEAGLRSSIMVDTANNIHLGVSRTLTALHLSEVARYERAAHSISAILGAVPLAPNTIIIMESTAFITGGYFKDTCARAQRQEGAWRFCFVPWFRSTEYRIPLNPGEKITPSLDELRLIKNFNLLPSQIKWRRFKIAEMRGDEAWFAQDFPATELEAWIVVGSRVFPSATLRKLKAHVRDPMRTCEIFPEFGQILDVPEGRLWIWQNPIPGADYDIGADVAMEAEDEEHSPKRPRNLDEEDERESAPDEEESDFSTIQVVRRGSLEQVAEWKGRVDPLEFADILAQVGYYYNTAQLAPETNDMGIATASRLNTHLLYPNIYRWRYRDRIGPSLTRYAGWETGYKSKRYLIAFALNLATKSAESRVLIHSTRLIEELENFVRIGHDKYGAASGHKDDLVQGWFISLTISNDEDFSRFLEDELDQEAKRIEKFYEPGTAPRSIDVDPAMTEADASEDRRFGGYSEVDGW